jgi:hypothetical protein
VCLSASLVRQGQSFTPPHDSAKVTDAGEGTPGWPAGGRAMGTIRSKGRSLRKGPASATREMSIECLTPVADGVNRCWEVDYLSQALCDL